MDTNEGVTLSKITGKPTLTVGLLGAEFGSPPYDSRLAVIVRLDEIERRILAIEARLNELAPPPAAEG